MWPYLSIQKKDKILEIISTGKGTIPYELSIDMESFFITPDQEFWEKTKFFSEVKQSVINNEDYEHSNYLYQTLKMGNLGDFFTSRKICVRISNQILVRNLSHFFHNFVIG